MVDMARAESGAAARAQHGLAEDFLAELDRGGVGRRWQYGPEIQDVRCWRTVD
jgi:hypothetical protein